MHCYNFTIIIQNIYRYFCLHSLPFLAWVHTLDEDEEDENDLIAETRSLPQHLPEAQLAQHNSTPSPRHLFKSEPPRGRLWDHAREWTPPLPTGAVTQTASRWRAFRDASAYPAISADEGQIVDEQWLIEYGADYSRPWLAGDVNGDPEKNPGRYLRYRAKRRAWYIRAQRTVLRNPIIPLVIRMNVWVSSAVALALASNIHYIVHQAKHIDQKPSTAMAIVVDAVAMVYLVYIMYDEYSGKPLGLRPAKAKMRLIFLDLFFIVFDSANLSLAFEAIESEACEIPICSRQKALASVLLVALIAWLSTFSISVMR